MIILPRDDLKKQEVLAPIAKRFKPGKIYPEDEVNDIVESFNVEDKTLFKRELINFGYLDRDPLKGTYWHKKHELSKEELQKIAVRSKKIQDMS